MNRHRVFAAAIVLFALTTQGRALDFDYAKIAEAFTLVPTDPMTLIAVTSFDYHPVIDGYGVAFYAESAVTVTPLNGIYLSSGGVITKVVNTAASVPSGAAGTTFTNFIASSYPSISNGNVAFGGYDNASHPPGVYTNVGGLNRVADYNTPLPSGSWNLHQHQPGIP